MNPYIPHTDDEVEEMLKSLQIENVEELFKAIPYEKRVNKLGLAQPMDEYTVLSKMKDLSRKNSSTADHVYFIGGGIYNHVVPSAVRQIVMRGDFYTAYTPYQAEVSQGSLQTMFEFQTMICELTAMGISNASMYDGAEAAAEAMLMACRYKRRSKILVADSVHPEYLQTIRTYANGPEIAVETFGHTDTGTVSIEDLKSRIDDNTAGVMIQYPNFFGVVEDVKAVKDVIKDAMLIVVVNPIALGILEAPGNLGADIVVGDGQTLGIPMNFGGPSFGLFAIRDDMKLVRTMPGRIIGETVDAEGKRGFVMTLQTREQHIRRAKATSNICSNHALGTLYAASYLSLVGPQGLREIGENNLTKSHYLLEKLEKTGHFERKFSGEFFNEFVVKTDLDVSRLKETLLKNKIIAPLEMKKIGMGQENEVLFCATEANTFEEIECLINAVEAM